jgi:hypothetical protein
MHVRSFLVETLCPNFNSKDTPFICSLSQDLQGSLVSVQSGQMWGGTLDVKDTVLPPFMKILRAGLKPQGTGKTLIFSIQNNRQSFNRLQPKLQLFWTHHSVSCKDKQCDPLTLVIESSWSMTKEPSIFCKYGLGVDVSGTDSLRSLEFHLAPKPSQGIPRSSSAPMLPSCL